jgi:hypothetical protein
MSINTEAASIVHEIAGESPFSVLERLMTIPLAGAGPFKLTW